jgi:ADP-ribose pyrophosphatase YjhB (NUDIX family)
MDVQACAGALVYDADGRLLMVRRRNRPSLDLWGEPSGRCGPGEPAIEACVRECAEETGLLVRPIRRAGAIRLDGDGTSYEIEDFVCELVAGTLRAGDDAAEARWVSAAELATLELAPGVLECLTEWGALPR